MTLLGFQVVLLDEHGVELQRIPDVYEGSSWIVPDEYRYELQREAYEEGQRARYFKRVSG